MAIIDEVPRYFPEVLEYCINDGQSELGLPVMATSAERRQKQERNHEDVSDR